jgi:hypothetical protein
MLHCDETLLIARLAAETRYRNLADFIIRIAIEVDVWHVDFTSAHPHCRGGGPHYHIDATTGEIVWKTFEQ